jgi:hypothetical protein
VIRKFHVIVVCCIITIFGFSSLVSLPVASAQRATTYALGARMGDWATYNIEENNSLNYVHRTEGTVNITVTGLSGNFSVYDENNRTVMNWVIPSITWVTNGSWQDKQAVFDLPSMDPFRIDQALLCDCIPFYPKGADFWGAIEPYTSEIKINITQDAVTLTLETFEHYSTSSDNISIQMYQRYSYRLYVDYTTGVLLDYRRSESAAENYTNYYMNPPYTYNSSSSDSVRATLNNTSVSSASYPKMDPMVAFSVIFVPLLAVLVVATFGTHRKRYLRRMNKTETLRRLSDDDLMKLFKEVSSSPIDGTMEREDIIRILSQSLSLEEIETKLESE